MLEVSATPEWRAAHPGAMIGLLELSGLANAASSPKLSERKREIEASLRERYKGFARKDFLALPVMAAYDRYYARFSKTYHVQLQLESIVLKRKALPNVSPAMVIDLSREDEQMTQMNGATKPIRAGDMIMRDAGGISCSVIYGQDARSPISPQTSHVLTWPTRLRPSPRRSSKASCAELKRTCGCSQPIWRSSKGSCLALRDGQPQRRAGVHYLRFHAHARFDSGQLASPPRR